MQLSSTNIHTHIPNAICMRVNPLFIIVFDKLVEFGQAKKHLKTLLSLSVFKYSFGTGPMGICLHV